MKRSLREVLADSQVAAVAIERAFAKLSVGKEVVTDGGHREKMLSAGGEGELLATDSQ
jgi:hypothetical protein